MCLGNRCRPLPGSPRIQVGNSRASAASSDGSDPRRSCYRPARHRGSAHPFYRRFSSDHRQIQFKLIQDEAGARCAGQRSYSRGGRAPVKPYFCTWLFLYCLIVIVLSLLSSLPGDPRRRLQLGFGCNPWHVLGFKTVFGAILGTFRASKRFLVQNEGRRRLQIGFWCNPRRVLGFKTVFGAILGTFRAPKRFLVQSSARFGLQNGFWRETTLAAGLNSIFGPIRGSF